jgi:PAP2 superfamily
MKNIFYIVILTFIIASCNKNVTEANLQYPLLNPTRLDTNAGTWKPILLSVSNEFACATPIATNAPDYIIQLNEIKSYQQDISSQEQALVNYWGAGAVLRWNEIMRELVAKHNLPPYQNADGTYPIPSAANPLAYPTFPFSNPPYAARAYAYLSTAQYDACVATYYYKQLFNRAAPYNIDSNIKSLLPKSIVASYPSEDACVLGASVEILKLLFPGDQEYINQKAEEHKRARLISGANVRSDLDAGEMLGKQVAAKFIARARTDKAGAAVGNVTIWAQQKAACEAIGEMPWESLELTARPGMLPLFGKVKPFLFDSTILVTTLRPVAPPSTKSQAYKEAVAEVYNFSKNLTRNQLAIAHFWADGVGTFTPPGHWNYIAATAFAGEHYSEARWARNMALLNMSMMDAAIVCWDAKYNYYLPRPSQIDDRIKTVTGVPNFPAYISGHSTFSGAAANVLGYLIPSQKNTFDDMAKEASISRLYAAIHYRFDCEVGLDVGAKVGNYAIARGHVDGGE